MTPEQLKSARSQIAPTLSQAAFARGLGYADQHSYRRYESGLRPIPDLLAQLIDMFLRHPEDFPLR